jgi:spermidine synthase
MQLLHTAPIPGEAVELGLYKGGEDYYIKFVGGPELMGTRAHASEDALGSIACRTLRGKPGVRVLIGGLGMGFTLAASLKKLDDDAEVIVAELVPEVVEWNRGVLGEFAGRPMDDPRTRVETVDVSKLIRKDRLGFNAIMLDVDNGPDGLTRDANGWLYSNAGLARMLKALRPGGALAIWSEGPDRAFTKRLRAAGFDVEQITVRAHAGKGTRHVIWMARVPPGRGRSGSRS